MKIRFIINLIAGTGKQKNIEKYIKKNIKKQFEIKYTKGKGDAKMLAKKAIIDKVDKIIAVGGDGTVNEIISVIIGTKVLFGVIPCGSGNGFALHIGMSTNIVEAIQQINNGIYKKIDTCILNEIPFINVAGVGFDAHIANIFSKEQKRGFLKYIWLILKELKYKPVKYNIELNGKDKNITAFLVAFANTSQYGNNSYISPDSCLHDGFFEVVIIKSFPKWKIPIILYKIMVKKINSFNYKKIIKTKEIKINAKNNLLIHVDGEAIYIKNKIEVKINHKSLNVIFPYEKK